MPLYFHVQRSNVAGFRTGKSYGFAKEENFFARDLFAVDPIVPVAATEGLPIDYLLHDYFDPTGFRHYRNMRGKAVTPDEKGLLKSAHSVLKHQTMLLRELIFEHVRQESFPDKPCRLKGIWLIPHDEQLLAQWCATAPHGQFRAFEIEACGKIHQGYSRYLKPECISVAKLRENARLYWSDPVNVHPEAAEILLEGEIKVIREVRMAGSKQSTWTKLKRLF